MLASSRHGSERRDVLLSEGPQAAFVALSVEWLGFLEALLSVEVDRQRTERDQGVAVVGAQDLPSQGQGLPQEAFSLLDSSHLPQQVPHVVHGAQGRHGPQR